MSLGEGTAEVRTERSMVLLLDTHGQKPRYPRGSSVGPRLELEAIDYQ